MALGPLNELVLGGIRFYQVKIGTNSVSRCPYVVSCSAFAKQSFTELGFFGLPAFLDRFFYRENPDTFVKYPRYVMPDGVIRYDDAAFHLDSARGRSRDDEHGGVAGRGRPGRSPRRPTRNLPWRRFSPERTTFLEGFAASLARERDYYRAISVWKELRFGAPDPRDRVRYSLSITHAYRASQRYASALSASPHVLQSEVATPAQRAEAELLSGESYLGLKIPFQAEVHLAKGLELSAPCSELAARAELMLGVARAEAGDWPRARAYFLRVQNGKSSLAPVGTDFAAQALKAPDMPQRSPLAAAVLSGLLPGLGQAYTGHWVDAGQALFSWGGPSPSPASRLLLRARGRPASAHHHLAALTSIFHISNITERIAVLQPATARHQRRRIRDRGSRPSLSVFHSARSSKNRKSSVFTRSAPVSRRNTGSSRMSRDPLRHFVAAPRCASG